MNPQQLPMFLVPFLIAQIFSCVSVNAAPFLPVFDDATFIPAAPIDNPYFPLLDNLTRIYEGQGEEDGEEFTERFELTVMGPGPVILGVQTTSRRDRAFEDDLLVEETFDYYAQDNDGNVWYFGEDVTNFFYDDDDNLVGTDNASAWRAGVNDALPGYIMPADLTVGFNYYQEFAGLDDALDEATTFAVDQLVSLDFGDFVDVLQVFETSALEPDAREFKYYAPGFGLILVEEDLNEQLTDPALRVALVGVVGVPEPGGLSLLGLGFTSLLALRRNRRRYPAV